VAIEVGSGRGSSGDKGNRKRGIVNPRPLRRNKQFWRIGECQFNGRRQRTIQDNRRLTLYLKPIQVDNARLVLAGFDLRSVVLVVSDAR
jgi:hypothetical protein